MIVTAWLSQIKADALFAMEKHRVDDRRWALPDLGGRVTVPLTSADGAEAFHLDISRGQINLAKGKMQNRGRVTLVLARIDFGGAPHRNPDDQEIACPHVHLYREGFGDRWAFPIPTEIFRNPADHWTTLVDFMRFCTIIRPPDFAPTLFT